MAKKVTYKVKNRRRRDGQTNYGKRLMLLKSEKPRFVVRLSNKKVVVQAIEYKPEGDKTLVNTTSLELKKYGWKGTNGNVCAAYLTGLLCGKKALGKGIKEGVLDIGLQTPVRGSNVFAALKGLVDAGVNVPHDAKALPPEENVLGKHIETYRNVTLNVADVKTKILGSTQTEKKEVKKDG